MSNCLQHILLDRKLLISNQSQGILINWNYNVVQSLKLIISQICSVFFKITAKQLISKTGQKKDDGSNEDILAICL